MTREEALLVADGAHDTNTVDAVALTTLATEVRRQHAALEETLKDLALASAERDIAKADVERLRADAERFHWLKWNRENSLRPICGSTLVVCFPRKERNRKDSRRCGRHRYEGTAMTDPLREAAQAALEALDSSPNSVTVRRSVQVAMSHLRAALAQPDQCHWVAVADRLPDINQSVALVDVGRRENVAGDFDRNVHACGYLSPGGYWSVRGERALCLDSFTHWMSLPEAPK